jgi:hypothetical protein
MGCGGGEEGFLWVRGVEAGRAGTGPEADPLGLDVIIGLERFVKGGWLGGKKEKGWETVGDWVGNGFEFEFGDGNWFGLVALGAELFVGTVNGFAFAAAGNGFIVCPVLGNGFVGCILGPVGKGLVPSKPFCAEKGFGTIGTGGGGFVWPNGESPVACMGKLLERKGFAPVICD